MNNTLSVIIPYVNEHPQVAFTIASLRPDIEQLKQEGVEVEVIAINNMCEEVTKQVIQNLQCKSCHANNPITRRDDGGGGYLDDIAKIQPWLKNINYSGKLSHWNAKRVGIENASGDVLWHLDGHCYCWPGTLSHLYHTYMDNYDSINGTLHPPLTYSILERIGQELIYKPLLVEDKGSYEYSFTSYTRAGWKDRSKGWNRVACMSTCGMMISREIYESIGGWPRELGIYGGGENFLNYTLATVGKYINIAHTHRPLNHHGAPRGYNWNYDDHIRNKMIAVYLFGGEVEADKFRELGAKGRPEALKQIYNSVVGNKNCIEQRELIKKIQVVKIDDWARDVRAKGIYGLD